MSNTTTEDRTGLFIVFEGVEGAGKTTHLRRLSRRLDELGIAHLVVREPGGTPAGERIRDIVLDTRSELFPETETLLLLAARAEFVRRVVRPALERGELVLGDRYELSTLAYQGAARDIGIERAREVRELLEEGGIPCFISGEHFATNIPQLRAVLETKILIPREMKSDAEKLIKDYSLWQDKGRPASPHTRGASSHRRVRT